MVKKHKRWFPLFLARYLILIHISTNLHLKNFFTIFNSAISDDKMFGQKKTAKLVMPQWPMTTMYNLIKFAMTSELLLCNVCDVHANILSLYTLDYYFE